MYENENYSGYNTYRVGSTEGNQTNYNERVNANVQDNKASDANASTMSRFSDSIANNTTVNSTAENSTAEQSASSTPYFDNTASVRGVYSNAAYDTSSHEAGEQTNTAFDTSAGNNNTYADASYANVTFDINAAKKESKEAKEKKAGGFFKKALLSVSLGLFFGMFAGLGFYAVQQATGFMNQQNKELPSEVVTDVMTNNAITEGMKLNNTSNVTVVQSNVVEVAEEVMPAMVSIVNNYTVTSRFWGQTYSEQQASSGSGIIVSKTDSELLVVSNNHVVEGAEKLEVTFIDGTVAEAYIKGLDSDMDLAVIAIPLDTVSAETMDAITVATLGNSNDLKLGEPVIAIGNALGYGQSVTDGIVSALNREITMEDGSTGTFIQTNAAINPGNSGGALLNVNGEVIGINTSKIGGTAIEGMGYAIPITSASPIIADLMERQTRNKVAEGEMGYIGISLQEVTSQISAMYGMPQGIYVVSTEEGSAAQNAGIMTGDIITGFDGDKITSYEELQNVLQYYAAGDTATITVMRPEKGQYVQYDLEITLGKRPEEK